MTVDSPNEGVLKPCLEASIRAEGETRAETLRMALWGVSPEAETVELVEKPASG